MTNKSNDHLHRLICSLTRAEKRYFKLYTSRHVVGDHSNHQVLFDAVAKMREYDEAALLDKFKGEAFTRRFAIAKRRLYDMILKSLDAFHAESSIENRARRSLHQVEILFKKGLYKDSAKILKSIRRIAVERQMNTLLIDVKIWERRLMERTNYAELKEGEIEIAGAEMRGLLEKIGQQGLLWELKSELFRLMYKKGQARSQQNEDALNKLVQHEILKVEPESARGSYLFHHIHGAHAFATANIKGCQYHLESQLSILTSAKDQFSEEPHLILAALSNLIHVTQLLGDQAKVDVLLNRYQGLPTELKMDESEDLRLRVFATTASLEFSIGMQKGSFKDLVKDSAKYEEGIALYGEKLGAVRKAGLFYSLAFSHFAAGNTGTALKWCNRLLNAIHIDKSEDIICFGHLLNLLIHLESGHTQLLPYAIRSSERYLKTRKRVYRFESLFLEMVKALSKAKLPDQRESILKAFIDSARKLRSDSFESPVFEHLLPIYWALATLNGTTIESAMRLNDGQQAA